MQVCMNIQKICNCTIHDAESDNQYCKEAELLIASLSALELDIYDIIGNGRVTRNTVETLRNKLEGYLDDIIPILYILIRKQYIFGATNGKSYTDFRELDIREDIILEELEVQLEEELTKSINNLYIYLFALINREIIQSSLEYSQRYNNLINLLKESGLVAFVDANNHDWQLSTYGEMLIRTYSRQSTNIGILLEDIEHDLYMVSAHDTACPICIPYENRVFSRSGNNPNYPPIWDLFGIRDTTQPGSLENSWLNIHPNCLHFLIKFNESSYSDSEIERIRTFSSFTKNPIVMDEKFERQMKEYRKKQYETRKELNDAKQHKRYRFVLGESIPKSFARFRNIKYNNPEQYKEWMKSYRKHLRD